MPNTIPRAARRIVETTAVKSIRKGRFPRAHDPLTREFIRFALKAARAKRTQPDPDFDPVLRALNAYFNKKLKNASSDLIFGESGVTAGIAARRVMARVVEEQGHAQASLSAPAERRVATTGAGNRVEGVPPPAASRAQETAAPPDALQSVTLIELLGEVRALIAPLSADLTIIKDHLGLEASRKAFAARFLPPDQPSELDALPRVPFSKLADELGADAELLGGPQAAERLRVSRQTVNDWVRSGKLISLPRARRGHAIPAWQIAGPDRLIDDLDVLISLFPDRPEELHLFMVQALDGLEGRTPIEALRRGDLEAVLAEASAAGEAYT